MSKEVWLKIFRDLKENGKEYSPRGEKTKEILNYQINFHPINDRFCSFKERKLSLSYNFAEWAWYITGNRDDLRMEEYAPFWKDIRNKTSPYYNSNYGYSFFTEKQFDYVFTTLSKDKDSRQAVIVINRPEVMMSDSKDKLCTNNIVFSIRDNKLNMYVQMRSNCVVTGLGIDCNMFSFLYECLFVKLKTIYNDLEIGRYIHNAISFHIYERHFSIMDSICSNSGENYFNIQCPNISNEEEIKFMFETFPKIEEGIRLNKKLSIHLPETYSFTKFLTEKICKRWQVEFIK